MEGLDRVALYHVYNCFETLSNIVIYVKITTASLWINVLQLFSTVYMLHDQNMFPFRIDGNSTMSLITRCDFPCVLLPRTYRVLVLLPIMILCIRTSHYTPNP